LECSNVQTECCSGAEKIHKLATYASESFQHEKGKTSVDLNEARDDGVWGCKLSGISWTIIMQKKIYTSLQTDNHTNTSSLNFYRPDALPDTTPNQQCQSTKGKSKH